jgi:DNA-binding transcriptional ArsR family regulator
MSRRRDRGRRTAPPADVRVFAALGDGTRLLLIDKLSLGPPCSISELTGDFDLTRQAVTKHLRVLESAGLIRSEREGREIRFEFAPASLDAAKKHLELVSTQWEQALARLKSFVEKDPKRRDDERG